MLLKKIKKNILFLRFLAAIGLTIFALIGCGGSGGGGGNPNTSTPAPPNQNLDPPHANLSTTQIAFGDLVLDTSSDQDVSIQNTGSSNLNVGQIGQANPLSAPFSILNDKCSGKQLTPSATCSLQVRFSPTTQGGFIDAFDIPSNDPGENSVTVNVSGDGKALNVALKQVSTGTCPIVKSLITILDKSGNPVSGLAQNNFSLSENGVSKVIEDFYPDTSPISVALVLDYSGSMESAIPDMEGAAKLFIDRLNSSNNDEAAVIKFATEFQLMQQFTTSKDALKKAIDTPFSSGGDNTSLYDTLWFTVDVTAQRANRLAIIVLSDGNDYPGSIKGITEVINHANERGVPIYTIGLGDLNTKIMTQLADNTGGQYFFAPTSNELYDIYQLISEIFKGQYIIKYNSSSSGSGLITLEIKIDFNDLQGRVMTTATGCP